MNIRKVFSTLGVAALSVMALSGSAQAHQGDGCWHPCRYSYGCDWNSVPNMELEVNVDSSVYIHKGGWGQGWEWGNTCSDHCW